jgi:hypothetical protein
MRRAKSLRIGVHNANAVVWGPVYERTIDDELVRTFDDHVRHETASPRGAFRGSSAPTRAAGASGRLADEPSARRRSESEPAGNACAASDARRPK